MKTKRPARVSRSIKEKEEQENHAPSEEPCPEVEIRHSENMSDCVPMITLNEVHEPEGETSISPNLDLLRMKRKTAKRPQNLTRTKEPTVTKVVDSSDTSVTSSKGGLVERISPLLTKERGIGPTDQNHTSSLLDDASMVESKKEEIRSLLQVVKDREHRQSSAGGTENTNRNNRSEHEENDRLIELSRLKARLEMVRNERTSKASLRNRKVMENWTDSPPPPSQAMNSEHFMNRLLSKEESPYIQTECQEPESKSDDLSVDSETRSLISHVRRAIQQNGIGSNEVLLHDPIFRLVHLAKELADQAGQVDLFPCPGEYFSSIKSLPSIPPSTVSHPMILQDQDSCTSSDHSMTKFDSHPALDQSSGNSPSVEYLLKKLQAAEEECMELTRSKEALEASLMEANNVHRELEISVQSLKEELAASQATNRFLSDELNVAKEEIAALKDGTKKFEDELERTQNRLGDAIVHISDLESDGASLRQMVGKKDKEIDGNMALFQDQHQSVVNVLDHTQEIRRQMTNLQGQLSEEDNCPEGAQKLCDDWFKEALAQLDSMDMTLTTCKSELEVKLQPSDDEEKTKESSNSAKVRWSLFRKIR